MARKATICSRLFKRVIASVSLREIPIVVINSNKLRTWLHISRSERTVGLGYRDMIVPVEVISYARQVDKVERQNFMAVYNKTRLIFLPNKRESLQDKKDSMELMNIFPESEKMETLPGSKT